MSCPEKVAAEGKAPMGVVLFFLAFALKASFSSSNVFFFVLIRRTGAGCWGTSCFLVVVVRELRLGLSTCFFSPGCFVVECFFVGRFGLFF